MQTRPSRSANYTSNPLQIRECATLPTRPFQKEICCRGRQTEDDLLGYVPRCLMLVLSPSAVPEILAELVPSERHPTNSRLSVASRPKPPLSPLATQQPARIEDSLDTCKTQLQRTMSSPQSCGLDPLPSKLESPVQRCQRSQRNNVRVFTSFYLL